ncbi:MAG: Gfo/Idh/MocA family oxidoreductase [Acidimicrobiales bacterium]
MSVRVGVVGAGGIGSDHIRRLRSTLSGVEVVAIADPDTARAAAAVEGLDATIETSGEELIANVCVDAVVVASPGFTHADLVSACLSIGKPVFCEKPLAITAADAWRVVEAEVATGRRLVQVGFMRRYDLSYLALKAVLDSGTIGQALVIHAAHRNPEVPEWWTTELTIKDSSVHDADIVRFLTGEEIVASTVLRPRASSRLADVQDPLIIVFETSSGILVDVELSVNIAYGYDIRAEVVGETGTAALGDGGLVTVKHVALRSTDVPADWRQRFNLAYDRELQDWVDATSAGEATGPSSWDGFVATAIAEASHRSYRDGTRAEVALPERPSIYR